MDRPNVHPKYSLSNQDLRQELANSLTHGVGLAFSVAAMIWLVAAATAHGDPMRIAGVTVYGASLVMMYAASTFYHGWQTERIKAFFHRMDHACIYLLIAGTYTPITLTVLRGGVGWTMFGVIWAMAIAGISIKLLAGVGRWPRLSTLAYLVMGWVAVLAIKPLVMAVPVSGLLWIVAGGLAYTVGVIFYVKDEVRYFHAVWHLFVLAGSVCHFFAIRQCLFGPSLG